MRGMELPINIIVIVAVAVLVLTVIAAFFTGALTRGTNEITITNAFQKGCQLLRTVYACNPASIQSVNIAGYRPTSGGIVEDPSPTASVPLYPTVCNLKGAPESTQCAQLCGCVV